MRCKKRFDAGGCHRLTLHWHTTDAQTRCLCRVSTAALCSQTADPPLAIPSATQPPTRKLAGAHHIKWMTIYLYVVVHADLRLCERRVLHTLLPKILNRSLYLRHADLRTKRDQTALHAARTSYDPWSLFALKNRAKSASSFVCPDSRSSIFECARLPRPCSLFSYLCAARVVQPRFELQSGKLCALSRM